MHALARQSFVYMPQLKAVVYQLQSALFRDDPTFNIGSNVLMHFRSTSANRAREFPLEPCFEQRRDNIYSWIALNSK